MQQLFKTKGEASAGGGPGFCNTHGPDSNKFFAFVGGQNLFQKRKSFLIFPAK
jgi:hypothetical protein